MKMLRVLPFFALLATAGAADRIPPVVADEFKRLEETYRVLDFVAEKIWPGWTGYRQVPFLLDYENGLHVLVGHPNPPKPFERTEYKVEDREVWADYSALNPKPLVAPLYAGGGPVPFGSAQVVRMTFRGVAKTPDSNEFQYGDSEEQISVYIHELFHCFQMTRLRGRLYGNLRFNPDVNFAVYAEIEGLALQRAYAATDPEQSKRCLIDFLAARRHKRTSMTALQRDQESFDEFNEGTATYVQLRVCEIMKQGGFRPGLPDDRYYHGFRDAERLGAKYLDRLKASTVKSEDAQSKKYDYGCFQAALCDRLFPGWQKDFPAAEFVDRVLMKRLAVPEERWAAVEQGLETAYPYTDIHERHARVIGERDEVYRILHNRKGRVYIVDFKKTGQYVAPAAKVRSWRVGLNGLYPEGLGTVKFDEVELTGLSGPCETNQLFYIRAVDTEARGDAKPYTLDGARQPDGTWKSAVVTTPLFTLKAPRVRIREAGDMVKIQVLGRVKD